LKRPSAAETAYQRRTVRSFLLNFLEEEDGSLRRNIDLHEHALETGKPITDATVQEVCKLQPNLEELTLTNATLMGDVGLWAVARHCPNIRGLGLSGCTRITNVGLRAIALRCSTLKKLDLSGCNVDDISMRTLASGCWQLETLLLRACTGVSDAGLVDIARCCTNLTELNVSECTRIGEFGDVSLVELGKNCTGLRRLDMLGCKHVRDDGLRVIAKGCPDLEILKLTGCKDITGKAVKTLAKYCTALEQLSIAGCNKVKNNDMMVLANACRSLKSLDISECANISASGLHSLATRCRSLEELNLSGCPKVDDSCCIAMAQPMNRLQTINLSECSQISESGVQTLAVNCTGLGYLNLNGCKKVGRRFLMNLITRLKFSEPAHEYYGYQPRPDADELRAEMEALNRRVMAALTMQRVLRGRAARKIAWRLRREWIIKHRLTQVQANIRRYIHRKRFLREWEAYMRDQKAARIQAAWRAFVDRRAAQRLEEARLQRLAEEKSGLLAQRIFRGHQSRQVVQQLRDEKARNNMEEAKVQARLELAAVMIQKYFRSHKALLLRQDLLREKRRKLRLEKRRLQAAILMQRQWRIVPAKGVLKHLKEEKARKELEWKCARKIQAAYRMRMARIVMQALAAERERQRVERAAIMVQTHWRAMRARFMAKVARTARMLREKERRAAVRVQAAWRGKVGRRLARERKEMVELQRLRERSALAIQRVFRGHKGRERWEVCQAVDRLADQAAPLTRKQAQLGEVLEGLRGELAKIDEMAEPRKQKLRFLETEVKKVLDTKAVWYDSSSISGTPQRYLTKYLQVQLSEKLTQAKEDAELALEKQASLRGKIRETERVLRQVKRELLPLQRGIELETKELRTQRLRNQVRQELWAAHKIQSVFRGYRVRAALSSEIKEYWGEYSDEATGDIYYFNSWTEDTRWVKPLEMTLFEELFAEKPKELGWKEETDNRSGMTYYFNEVVMEYRWEKPPDDDEITEASEESRGRRWFRRQNKKVLMARSQKLREIGQYEEWQDPKKGMTFYYNPLTLETKWSLPPHEAFPDVPAIAEEAEAEVDSLTEFTATSEEWVKVEDPNDGAIYYYNQNTGESSWEIPEGFQG